MKLVQFWKNNAPALGIQTEKGIVDAAAEAAVRGLIVPQTMLELIRTGKKALEQLEKMAENPACFTDAPLAPAVTGMDKVLCTGLNYRQHAIECGAPIPEHPVIFSKFPSTLSAHGAEIKLLEDYVEYDYEAELVIVMGKTARHVSEEDALDYVFGFTCGNDLSERWLQHNRGGQWILGKTLEGFGPIGPCVATADSIDCTKLDISCRVNGEERQHSNTSDFIFPVARLIADLSHHMTLLPGDVIFTGTPSGVMLGYPADQKNWLKAGDTVEVTIEGIGTLTNTFR